MMENKKDMVKQTKEITKTDHGNTGAGLITLLEVLKTRAVYFDYDYHIMHLERRDETIKDIFIFDKQMKKITHTHELINKTPKEVKISNAEPFNVGIIFEDLKTWFKNHGGFITFINKINGVIDKVKCLGAWEQITGEHVKTVPLKVWKGSIIEKGPGFKIAYTYFSANAFTDYPAEQNSFDSIKEITLDQTGKWYLNQVFLNYLGIGVLINKPELYIIQTFLFQWFNGSWERPGTFAIPSDHKHWDPILLLFAGDPGIVRKKAFRKSPEDRTPEEQTEVDAYTENLFNTDAVGRIASVNILNAGNGNLDVFLKPHDQTELFNRDLSYQKGKAITEFYKTIGSPEGLRHYLAIFQGLDRAGRTGRFTFDMNKHLDRLGYKKQNGEKHRTRNKETALKIIQFLDNAVMDIQDPKDPTKNNRFRLLSSNIRYDNRKGISPLDRVETIKITMDDWYLDSFKDIPGKGPRYTKLLDQLLTEDHQRHGITLLVVPRLAILWRINGPEGPPNGLTVSWLLNVTAQGNHRKKESIKRLEGELEYMKQKNYIGEWTHDGNGKTIHESNNPESVHTFITGPDWSRKEMEIIKENRDQAVTLEIEPDPMTFEEFDRIFQALKDAGYSQENIARHTGLSRTALYNWKTRKRKISNGNAEKIREFYFSVTEKPDDDPETM